MRIERKPEAGAGGGAKRRSGGGGKLLPALLLLTAIGAIALFWPRLRGWVDRVRLPEVEIAVAVAPSPLAASAVSGTSANGYVVASKRAALSADAPGRIVEMNVVEGSVVKKGFVVARLYSDEYKAALDRASAELASSESAVARAEQETGAARGEVVRLQRSAEAAAAALDEARATLLQAQQRLARAEQMVADDVESRQWLDDARADAGRAAAAERAAAAQLAAAAAATARGEQQIAVQEALHAEARSRVAVAKAAREQAQATFDKTEVRAPFDGVVVLKDAEVGEVVSPNSQGGNSRGSVATMVDFATLEVQVEMPERTISAVAVGAPATIFLDAFPDRGYAGEVTRIWPTANRSKATIEVRVRFAAPDERLRPEMGARVVFRSKDAAPLAESAPAPKGVLVPERALRQGAAGPIVWVVRGGDAVQQVAVAASEASGGRVLVTKGLAPRDRVVVDPPAGLADGDRVRSKEKP
ncbi:MAG: efflux RND transporter periplasmic adaptor subunit [Planctomycetes bacterium]|nr:efflux RND transporter periplasmic adaptor subunit [Planctomycetota bacterium]